MVQTPYIVDITVYDNTDTVVSSITITAYNESTGELITANTVTNSSGQTLMDLANFNEGYNDGDYIQFKASGDGSVGTVLKFKAVCKTDFAQINQLDINYEK